MVEISINEVTKQTGIPPSTLRYYDEIGLLPPLRRVGGRRHYDESVFQRLALIQTGQQAGFTLAELRILLNNVVDSDSADAGWQDLVTRKLKEMNALLQNVQSMKRLLEDILECQGDGLVECILQTGQKHSHS